MSPPEGWAKLSGSRRFHYYLGETSICQTYRLKDVPTFETVTPPESECCMKCRREEAELRADRNKLANWNRAVAAVRDAGGAP